MDEVTSKVHEEIVLSPPLLLSSSSRSKAKKSSADTARKMHAPIARSSPSPSTSSSISENYSQDDKNYDNFRAYSHLDDGPHVRRGSLSPSGSVVSIHDAHFLNDRIRCLESEKLALMIDHNNLIREFNKRMESHLEEIRNLKEANQHLEQESNELRDLCCFLDDDRQKCRRLAKEWQRFGKHTVTVMRNEVISYQEKLRSLETRQSELIKENGELRDLCVYLDSQRTGHLGTGTQPAFNYSICKECSLLKKENIDGEVGDTVKSDLSSQNNYSSEHFTALQHQILQLEKEKDTLHKLLMFGGKNQKEKKRVSFSVPTEDDYDSSSTTSEVDRLDFPPSFGSTESFTKFVDSAYSSSILRNGAFGFLQIPRNKKQDISPRNNDISRLSDTVSEEQIMELREKLNRSKLGEATLTEQEISVLKDMCNVVTQKMRSDSNTSLSSLNNSFDLNSPLSPPPLSLGSLQLYNRRGSTEPDNRTELQQILEHKESEERPPFPGYDSLMINSSIRNEITQSNDILTAEEDLSSTKTNITDKNKMLETS